MVWQRPVPLIGDPSAASQRAADPAGWALPVAQRDALHTVVAARRDVRRFRPDPVPDEVLWRVLGAAHRAPSVGHSQPWRFVVVRDAALRERAALLADRERLRQAAAMEPESARRLLDLQLEGIREAPLGVVVCCDRRTPAAGVLGRATYPDTDLWSCATAIQNLWLAARADGLGLGWVTLFRPEELAELVRLPAGVATLGWLCLGWPDERPPDPGLERAGWSRRMPVADVVLFDRWPADGAQPPPPSHLRAPSQLRAPAQDAVVAARDDADQLLTPPGSLGVLDQAVNRVLALGGVAGRGLALGGVAGRGLALGGVAGRGLALGGRAGSGPGGLSTGALVLACADHPVTVHGISAYPAGVTREVLAAAAVGAAVGVTAAQAAGLATVLVDAGVTGPAVPGVPRVAPEGPRGDLVNTDAMRPDDVWRLLAAGRDIGYRAGGSGLVALGEAGVGNTTVAAALTCALLAVDPAAAVGLGAGADTAILDRKRRVVAAAIERTRGEYGQRLTDPRTALAAVGGPEIAILAGVVLGAAESGAVVVLDGLATGIAALIAVQLEPAVAAHLIAGQRSREPAHALVLTELGCEPLLDLRIRAGEGVAACLAVGLLRQALTVRRYGARVEY